MKEGAEDRFEPMRGTNPAVPDTVPWRKRIGCCTKGAIPGWRGRGKPLKGANPRDVTG